MTDLVVRPIRADDAEAYLDMLVRIDGQSEFLLLEPGERVRDIAQQRERLAELLQRDNQTIVVAQAGSRLVGYTAVFGGAYRRTRHCGYIVMAVELEYTGQGLGTRLFAAAEQWARSAGLTRLELTVMIHNRRAIGLYKKAGFVIEGTRSRALLVDGNYVDEYYMGKLL